MIQIMKVEKGEKQTKKLVFSLGHDTNYEGKKEKQTKQNKP